MPNTPKRHGNGWRVQWKHRFTGKWQSKTISKFDTDRENKRVALALYDWLRSRNDAVLGSDPAIQQFAFLRPDQPPYPAASPTYRQIAEEVLTLKVKIKGRAKELRRGQIYNHFRDWADRPISEITDLALAKKASAIHEYAGLWSYRSYMSFCLAVLRRGFEQGHIEKDPTRDFVIGEPDEPAMAIMTPEQYLILRDSAASEQAEKMTIALIQTGCRISEVHALQAGDVRVGGDDPHVFICRSFTYASGGKRIEGLPKNGKARPISLDSATAELFRDLVKGLDDSDLVFPTPSGSAWQYGNWRTSQWVPTVKAAVEAGFPEDLALTPHDLRHTHASWLLAAGADLRSVSERLGHSNPAFTLRKYIHATQRGDDRLKGLLSAQSEFTVY